MSEADGKAIVRRFFDEAWNQNRVAELNEYISADNIHRGPSDDGPRGPEQIRQGIKRWRTGFPDFRYQIEALIAKDDLVTARVTMIGTHTGILSFASRILPPTGKLLRTTEIFIFRIAGGKIIEFWATWDRLSALEQLGTAPATMHLRSRIIPVSDLPWEDRQPGVKRKSLWEDPATQRRAIINRIEPSARFARHRHVGDELVFVIEGAISDEFGTITAGNMGYRPHGCVHSLSTKHGVTALFIITGRTEPATERGTAPPSEIIALHELPWVERGPGVRQKQIWEDTASERRALLARFEPGTTLPPHRHVGDELIFVIEGANADESGAVTTGNMNYRPNGCVHSVTTQNGATVLAVVWGRTEPV